MSILQELHCEYSAKIALWVFCENRTVSILQELHCDYSARIALWVFCKNCTVGILRDKRTIWSDDWPGGKKPEKVSQPEKGDSSHKRDCSHITKEAPTLYEKKGTTSQWGTEINVVIFPSQRETISIWVFELFLKDAQNTKISQVYFQARLWECCLQELNISLQCNVYSQSGDERHNHHTFHSRHHFHWLAIFVQGIYIWKM